MADESSTISAGLAVLVTFCWGAGMATVARYTSLSNDLTLGADTFAAEPSIEVTLGAQTGGAQDVAAQVRMLVRAPLDTLTSQRAHSPVRVTIEEMDPEVAESRRTLFSGMIKTSTRNPGGKTGVVEIEIAGWRYALALSANAWLADTTCNNTFGDLVCGADLGEARQTRTITAVAGNTITVNGTAAADGYWRFGYVTFEGLSIMVREHTTADGAGNQLVLLKTPPANWLDAAVTLTPGCAKTLAACRAHGREARFTGFGLKIPAYNPLLESA